MIGMDVVEHGAGVDLVDDSDRHVVEPDIFAQRNATAVRLQYDMAGRIVVILRRHRRRHEVRVAPHQALETVIGIGAVRRAGTGAVAERGQIAVTVIGFDVGQRSRHIADAVSRGVVGETARRHAALADAGEPVRTDRIGIGLRRPVIRLGQTVAVGIIGPRQRAIRACGGVQTMALVVGEGLAVGRVDRIADRIERLAGPAQLRFNEAVAERQRWGMTAGIAGDCREGLLSVGIR